MNQVLINYLEVVKTFDIDKILDIPLDERILEKQAYKEILENFKTIKISN